MDLSENEFVIPSLVPDKQPEPQEPPANVEGHTWFLIGNRWESVENID
jgi:hypothetical protein